MVRGLAIYGACSMPYTDTCFIVRVAALIRVIDKPPKRSVGISPRYLLRHLREKKNNIYRHKFLHSESILQPSTVVLYRRAKTTEKKNS
jgi:hypothetical protein